MVAKGRSDQGGTGRTGASSAAEAPAWADGLKQLYDDVVDEPIPDAFKDLLAKLDADAGTEDSA